MQIDTTNSDVFSIGKEYIAKSKLPRFRDEEEDVGRHPG